MDGHLRRERWLVGGVVTGAVVVGVVWLMYLTGIGNFLLTAVGGVDQGNTWVPLVEHAASLSSGEQVFCYDDAARSLFCERAGFTKTRVLGYLLKDAPSGVLVRPVWSCATQGASTSSPFRLTTTSSDCTTGGLTRYLLGYVFDRETDVPDVPAVRLVSCTRGNAVRAVGNGDCADNGFTSPLTLGYAAPAGDQLQSLCGAMKEACAVAELSAFCLTTLDAHCRLSPTALPSSPLPPTPLSTVTPVPAASPTVSPSPSGVSVGAATIFITSKSYPATFGGLGAADTLCRTLAQTAGLPRAAEYTAVLSDSRTDARDRFDWTGILRLVNGTVVASGKADLWDGSIGAPININERGEAVAAIVWTGTDATGDKDVAPTTYCADWTSSFGGVEAGRYDRTNGQWVSIYGSGGFSAHACNNTSALYCIGPS